MTNFIGQLADHYTSADKTADIAEPSSGRRPLRGEAIWRTLPAFLFTMQLANFFYTEYIQTDSP